MSLQWMIVTAILYAEVAVLLLLLLPGIRPMRWVQLFDSRLAHIIKDHGDVYFLACVFVLGVLFADAIRELAGYQPPAVDSMMFTATQAAAGTPHTPNMMVDTRLVFAQRNLHISGFALLLFLVIKRIADLLRRDAVFEKEAMVANERALNREAKNLLYTDGHSGVTEITEPMELRSGALMDHRKVA